MDTKQEQAKVAIEIDDSPSFDRVTAPAAEQFRRPALQASMMTSHLVSAKEHFDMTPEVQAAFDAFRPHLRALRELADQQNERHGQPCR